MAKWPTNKFKHLNHKTEFKSEAQNGHTPTCPRGAPTRYLPTVIYRSGVALAYHILYSILLNLKKKKVSHGKRTGAAVACHVKNVTRRVRFYSTEYYSVVPARTVDRPTRKKINSRERKKRKGDTSNRRRRSRKPRPGV